jgi:hypothetical protein
MRLQSSEAACGPNSVSNAAKALGLSVSESDVSTWLDKVRRRDNPAAEGTTEDLLLRSMTEGAPKKLRLRARAFMVHDRAVALGALRGFLEDGAVAVLAVDGDTHWVAAVGRNGGRFLVADGGDSTGEVTLVYSAEQLAARWETAGNPSTYFGIVMYIDGSRR